jgi:hypothetical protein
MDINEIQDRIDELQEKVDLLTQERVNLDWSNAPVICELNGSRWVLGPECPEKLNWFDAVEWCKSVGGELPSREVLLMSFVNEEIRPLFPDTTYWSSTEFSAPYAWYQYYYNGNQYYYNKTTAFYVRAVRRLDI